MVGWISLLYGAWTGALVESGGNGDRRTGSALCGMGG